MQEFLFDFEHRATFDLNRSLFDHGELRIRNRIVLREHFRCMPEIIRFSNDLSYQATPLVPLRQYPPKRLAPLVARHVPAGLREGKGSSVINRPEAEMLTDAIVQCCKDQAYIGKNGKLTMGVISLQAWKQAEYIEQLLLRRLGAEEMASRRLLCGDAYSFQGDERDVIFLSMVAAPNAPIGALTKNADQQRFNVAASRAKDQLWLFHTVTAADLSDQCMRRRLLEHFDPTKTAKSIAGIDIDELQKSALRANRQIDKAPAPFESWFEVDVALRIGRKGYRVVAQHEVGGYRIDLVVEGAQTRLAVECDGDHWHGADRYNDDLTRQRRLERAKWTFARVRSCLFYASPEEALKPVWERLDALGIYPFQASEPQVVAKAAAEVSANVTAEPASETEASLAESDSESTEPDVPDESDEAPTTPDGVPESTLKVEEAM